MSNSSYDFIMDIISKNNIKLSRSEQAIVKKLKSLDYDISNLSINEFAKTFYVSTATATRFSQKLGFNGYLEFRYALKSLTDNRAYKSLAIYEDMISGIGQVNPKLGDFIKNLDQFHKIAIIGIGTSGLAANEFVYKLNEMNIINSDYAKEPYAIDLLTNSLNKDDLLIALSLSGENTNLLEGVDNALEKGAKILSLTRIPKSTLAQKSDFVFLTPSYSTYEFNISKMAPLIISIDIICEIYQATRP